MQRKTRKYYKPHSAQARANISAGVRAYQQRVREALAKVERPS
jgi:hypothetical protein